MAYETASATSPNDLLDKLRIFALANGWTVDYYGNRTNVGGASQGNSLNALALNRGGQYWVLYHDTTSNQTSDPTPRLQIYTYPGPWVATNGSDAQSSKSANTYANNLPGPYLGYHFFTDSARAYLHVAIEVVLGRFSHFGLGFFDKAGGGAAATYCYGLRWNFSDSTINGADNVQNDVPFDSSCNTSGRTSGGVVRADSDGISPRYLYINDQSGASVYADGGWRSNNSDRYYSRHLMQIGPSVLTGRSILVPLIIAIGRNGVTTQRSIIGTPFDMRVIRIDNLSAGDVVTIGSDNWKVFPVIRKNGPIGVENSAGYGYAYRVVP